MILLLGFAFLSGIITILSPCILPVLPIVLSGSLGKGRARPFGIVAGFVLSFVLFTLFLSALVQALGIPADAMRYLAVAMVLAFGLILLVPRLGAIFEGAASRLAAPAQGLAAGGRGPGALAGFLGGLPVGLSLGLVWTPCVGPIMASVISLALTRRIDGGSVLITLAYTLGTSIPMLAIMLGGRSLLARVPALGRAAAGIQRGFGVLLIVLGIGLAFGVDRSFQAALLSAFPAYGSGLTALEGLAPVRSALDARTRSLAPAGGTAPTVGFFAGAPEGLPDDGSLGDYGAAPDFVTKGLWFEGIDPASSPLSSAAAGKVLSLAQLRGKVVLVDFWTYSCVNCVRTLPWLRAWYAAYKDKGLVIVGVHSPEFEFEKTPSNVARAMRQLGVTWPVVQDNDYAQWKAYGNQYWPADYFIDAKGRVRYFHFGEGGYDVAEGVIKTLLEEAGSQVAGAVSSPEPALAAGTPETYLGYERGSGFASAVGAVADKAADYRPARVPGNGEWNLEGRWTISGQYIVPESSGLLSLGFDAKDVYLVVEPSGSPRPGDGISATLDGVAPADTPDLRGGRLSPTESRLYQLVHLPSAGFHVLTLAVRGRIRLFAFTFG